MGNACIAYVNLADDATITASSQVALLPITNVTVPHIARRWRGMSGATDNFVVDFGSLKTIDTIAVLGLTATQIRVRISSIDASGVTGDLFDSGAVPVDPNYLSYIAALPSTVSGRYVRVDLTTTGDYVEAGRIFVGARSRFSYNYVKGWQRSWVDLSARSRTRGGQTQVFANSSYRIYDVTFDFINATDRNGFVEDIDRVNGMRTDVLFITDPNSANLARDSVWGLMTTLTPVVQQYVGAFAKQYQIEERL